MNEQEFLAQFLADPEGRWEQFARQYAAVIEWQVIELGMRDGAGEDLLQEIYYELFRGDMARLRQWNPERGTFKTFLNIVVARILLDLLRSKRFRLVVDRAVSLEDEQATPCQRLAVDGPDPRELAEEEEVMLILDHEVRQLLSEDRIQPVDLVIFKCKALDLSGRDIGQLTGLSEDVVNLRFHRLKEQLRQATDIRRKKIL